MYVCRSYACMYVYVHVWLRTFMYGCVCTLSCALYVWMIMYVFTSVSYNTPVVFTHTILKLQVAVHIRAVTIEDLMDPVASTQSTRQTTAPAFGTFQYTIGAVRHPLTNAMALTAGHAAKF